LFDPDAKEYAQLKKTPELRKHFNLDGAYDYFSMLEDQLAGRIDSWAVRWQLSAFSNDLLTIYPRHSLIVNAGFDGSGTHGATKGPLARSGLVDEFSPVRFPLEIQVGDSWKEVCKMLRARLSILNRLKLKIKMMTFRMLEFLRSAT
jgi:hypothetical protein